MITRHALIGHTMRVTSLIHVRNALVSGSADGTLRVWDVTTGHCTGILEGHRGGVVCLCPLNHLGPHPRVVSGGLDGTLRIWNVKAGGTSGGTELAVLEGHEDTVCCITEKRDGTLVSGGADGSLRVWKLSLGVDLPGGGADEEDTGLFWECVAVLEGHTEPVFTICELPDNCVASASADHTLRLWSPGDNAAQKTPGTPDEAARRCYQCVSTLAGHTDAVWCATALANGRIVSGSADGYLRLWDTKNGLGSCRQVLEGHTNAVWALAKLQDGMVASGSVDASVQLWLVQGDYPPSRSRCSLPAGQRGVQCLAEVWADSGRARLAAGCWDGALRIWDVNSRQCEAVLEGHSDGINCIAEVCGERMIASGGRDGVIIVWGWKNH